MQGWGMTEMSPLGTVGTLRPEMDSLPLEEQFQMRAKAGHGIFGVAMKIVDDDGRELPWDGHSTGELKVRGPVGLRRLLQLDSRLRTMQRDGSRPATSR